MMLITPFGSRARAHHDGIGSFASRLVPFSPAKRHRQLLGFERTGRTKDEALLTSAIPATYTGAQSDPVGEHDISHYKMLIGGELVDASDIR